MVGCSQKEQKKRSSSDGLKERCSGQGPGCDSNHSIIRLSPQASRGHKIYSVFAMQKSHLCSLEVSLPLIITQSVFSKAQQSCPSQPACLALLCIFASLQPGSASSSSSCGDGIWLCDVFEAWGAGSSENISRRAEQT